MMRSFEVDTICRLCLSADEKVNRLNNTDQKVFIESIIKLKQDNYVPTDDLYICYICSALLTKSFNFIQTIWRAQKIVCAILKNTNMITKQLLYCIDRHSTGLNPITLTSVITFCDNSNNMPSDSNTSTDIEKLDLDILIKKEPKNQKNPDMNKINYHSTNENRQIVRISDEDEESEKCNIDEIKEEKCNDYEINFIEAERSDPSMIEFNTDEPISEIKKTVLSNYEDLKPNPSNEINFILSNSVKNEESDKCNLDEIEVEICNNFDIDGTKAETSDPLTEELNTDTCDEPIPKKKRSVTKKKPHSHQVKSKNSTSNKKKRKYVEEDIDDDYQPDSRHHVKSKNASSNEKKRKYVKEDIDDDYQPDSTSHSEDSDYDSYDDEGKRMIRPKDNRVYPMQCDHCNFDVLKKCFHYRHYQYMHPNIEFPYKALKDYACSICGKLYTKNRIGSHEAGHTNQKLKCSLCPKVFSNKIRRQRHMGSVHPKRTFTCDYCSKIFKTKGDITRHLRIHTGSKPFKCHICGDGFAHSGNRSIHIRAKHQNVSMKRKRTQKAHKKKENVIEILSDINVEQGSNNYQSAEIESDDEILAVIKRMNTQDEPLNKFEW